MRKIKGLKRGEIGMYPVFQFQADRKRDEPLCFVNEKTAHEMIRLDVAWSVDHSQALQYRRRVQSWREEIVGIEVRDRSCYGKAAPTIEVNCCEQFNKEGHHHKT